MNTLSHEVHSKYYQNLPSTVKKQVFGNLTEEEKDDLREHSFKGTIEVYFEGRWMKCHKSLFWYDSLVYRKG